jgi:hypothetical protein
MIAKERKKNSSTSKLGDDDGCEMDTEIPINP